MMSVVGEHVDIRMFMTLRVRTVHAAGVKTSRARASVPWAHGEGVCVAGVQTSRVRASVLQVCRLQRQGLPCREQAAQNFGT